MKKNFILNEGAAHVKRCTDAKRHGLLKGTKILRHYGIKMFRVRGEKAAMQLRSRAAKLKLSRHCEGGNGLPTEAIGLIKVYMDAKRQRRIVGFIEKRFGEVYQNRPVMLNLIQHLSISIDSINIDRLRVCLVARIKRVCNAAAFASSFRPVLDLFSLKTAVRSASPVLTSSFATRVTLVHKSALRAICKPAMTERLFSIGDREHASCAERTVMNFLPFTSHFSREDKRVAFTLAEVLITLGIIGVVAAMTMPVLHSKITDTVLANQNKKAQSIFANGMKMLMAREDVTDLELTAFYQCNYDDECMAKELANVFKIVGDDSTALTAKYEFSDETKEVWTNTSKIPYTFVTPDGVIFGILKDEENSGSVSVIADVNGTKRPNKGGTDLCKYTVSRYGTLAANCDAMTEFDKVEKVCDPENLKVDGCSESECRGSVLYQPLGPDHSGSTYSLHFENGKCTARDEGHLG